MNRHIINKLQTLSQKKNSFGLTLEVNALIRLIRNNDETGFKKRVASLKSLQKHLNRVEQIKNLE